MSQNILNNRDKEIKSKIYWANYNDFMLFGGKCNEMLASDIEDLIIADFSDWVEENGRLYSTRTWKDAISNGVTLKNIGLTGVDNGFISFDKDEITADELIRILKESTFEIPSGDTRFFLSPIKSNTKTYDYNTEILEDEDGKKYLACNGGFYQGFYKLEGHEYQTLPNGPDKVLTFHFLLRPRRTDEDLGNIVNKNHHNEGTFFFMGTRAENKFAKLYSEKRTESSDDEFANSLSGLTNQYEYINTDNKFLFFDRATGYTVDTWKEDLAVRLKMKKEQTPSINYHLIMDQTETGQTVDTIKQYEEENKKEYNIYSDLKNNLFSLFITSDGAIGYKIGALDCENENKYSVETEYSKNLIIPYNTWSSINVRVHLIDDNTMRIFIYVNGFLVLVSKELAPFNFKALDDSSDRQEGVPYNISIGGGTIGLAETILPEQYIPTEMLPVEKDFCGTFIGDIKSFKIINGYVPYSSMKLYL